MPLPLPTEGKPAPDFELESTEGHPVSLKSLKGKKVVLYFYPKDNTPGCTQEACAFRDSFADFKKVGAVIYGVSPDTLKKHVNFQKKFALPFPLLADTDHKIAEKFGIWKEKTFWGRKYMGVERTTYLIDSHGKIAKIFPKVEIENHHAEVLAALKDMD